MRIIYIIIILFALLNLNSCTKKINNPALLSLLDSLPNASVGLCVKHVETGKIIEKYNSNKSLRPASVLKLVTTATALDILKSNYRYNTQVGYVGDIHGDILKGSIVIKASGDPTWHSKYFPDQHVVSFIAKEIKHKGIKRITDGFIIDNSFINEDVPRTWIWEDIGNYYGSPSYGINYGDNTYVVEFTSQMEGTKTTIKSIKPSIEGVSFKNEVIASKKDVDNAWIFGSPYSRKRIIKGSIPSNRKSFRIKGAIPNPNSVFISELVSKLKKEGVVCNSTSLNKSNIKANNLFDVLSPELSDIVYITNQKSVNLFAESIGKKLMNGIGNNLDFNSNYTDFIKKYWKAKGLDVDAIELADFCGLSPFNMVSPNFMTDLLIYMHNNSDSGDCFINSLPSAGNSGTLKNFGKGTCLEKNLKAKTGSMKSVKAYCGYYTKDGKLFAFTFIVNNYTCKNNKLRSLVIELFKYYCN